MSSTVIVVPSGAAHAFGLPSGAPSRKLCLYAHSSPLTLVVTWTFATYDTEARASPRNPKVSMSTRSSNFCSFDVACRSHNNGRSDCLMPHPSSQMRNRSKPPPSTSTEIVEAPASRAFSRSSFNALGGFVTTSPAAIWFTTSGSKRRMSFGSMLASSCGTPHPSPTSTFAPHRAAPPSTGACGRAAPPSIKGGACGNSSSSLGFFLAGEPSKSASLAWSPSSYSSSSSSSSTMASSVFSLSCSFALRRRSVGIFFVLFSALRSPGQPAVACAAFPLSAWQSLFELSAAYRAKSLPRRVQGVEYCSRSWPSPTNTTAVP
mmetsp:Transcript_3965/g.12176  ORF Transcript_3965/g.12176 Transcript_3965/m.12176 type:complete len:319 (-) Transcript_3965:19-975(-)